jgi:hypothetical protein
VSGSLGALALKVVAQLVHVRRAGVLHQPVNQLAQVVIPDARCVSDYPAIRGVLEFANDISGVHSRIISCRWEYFKGYTPKFLNKFGGVAKLRHG